MLNNTVEIEDLIASGLVKKATFKDYEAYQNLSVLKYARKVFFKNLWGMDKRLLDARGLVLDENNQIVTLPFTKIFNYLENDTSVELDREVFEVDKINGFMCAVSVYNGCFLVSTTGSLLSQHSNIAHKYINKLQLQTEQLRGSTMLFEICDRSDPHIIDEEEGAYLIGFRRNELGSAMESEQNLDLIAKSIKAKRPSYCVKKFNEVLEDSLTCKREGFVVRSYPDGEVLLKLKSPHYLTKKALMRMGKKRVKGIYKDKQALKQQVDEEFYSFVDYLHANVKESDWLSMDEQSRRKLFEEYFTNENKRNLAA